MSRTVFISHSCKDLELDARPPALVTPEEQARRQRLAYARQVRDRIVGRLEAKGIDILLDRKRLEPGDQWRAKLHLWLGTCDAAVMLLNQESVQSEWVRKEATILTWRKSLRAKFPLIPVFLGDFRPADLRQSPLGTLDVSEVEGARVADPGLTDANADGLADQVVGRLEGLAAGPQDTELQRWVEEVGMVLKKLDPLYQDRARLELDIAPEDWADFENSRPALLAHQLLHTSLERAKRTLVQLKPGFQSDAAGFRLLVDRVVPIWVDEAAARMLVRDPSNPAAAAKPALLALNAREPATAVDYFNRGYCCPVWEGRIMDFDRPPGEGQVLETASLLEAALLRHLGLDAAKKQRLPARLQQAPFVVVLGGNVTLDPPFLEVVRRDYPAVTFLLLAGEDFADDPDDPTVAVRIVPPLAAGAEDAAANQRDFLTIDLFKPKRPGGS